MTSDGGPTAEMPPRSPQNQSQMAEYETDNEIGRTYRSPRGLDHPHNPVFSMSAGPRHLLSVVSACLP